MGYRERREETGGGRGSGAAVVGGGMGVGAGRRQGGYPGDLPPVSPAGGGMGYTPIVTDAQRWDREQSFYEESVLRQFGLDDETLAQNIQLAEMAAASAAQTAQIYASAGMAEAAAAAEASVQSSQIAAQAMRDVQAMDSATRLQIANIQAEVERERIGVERRIQESREFGQPINLASYIHYMTQGPGTAVPGTLPQQGVPQVPTAATGAAALGGTAGLYQMGMPGQAQMGTPAAIVGEPGAAGQAQPELLSMTPQGVQVTPIASQQVKPLQQMLGVPGMQGGGMITGYGGASGYTGGGNRLTRPSYYPTAPVRKTPTQMALPGWQQQAAQKRATIGIGGAAAPAAAITSGASGGAATPTTTTPTGTTSPAPTPATGEVDWQAFINQLYGNVPAYSWTGGLELPELGATLPYAPFGQNVTDWQNLPWQVQQGRLSMWRALGIMPETAMGMMYAAAPTGIAQPVAQRG